MTEQQAEPRGGAPTGGGRSHQAHKEVWGKNKTMHGAFTFLATRSQSTEGGQGLLGIKKVATDVPLSNKDGSWMPQSP